MVPRKRRKKSKNYFTQETEDYIVKYNNEPDSEVRSKIYETHIHYPFFKLTQKPFKGKPVYNIFGVLIRISFAFKP